MGSEMCIRDRYLSQLAHVPRHHLVITADVDRSGGREPRSCADMASKEPLLSSGTPVVQSLQGRFLSEAYYREKLAGFRKYDPGLWKSTLTVNMSPFMAIPFSILICFTLALVLLGKAFPPMAPFLALGPQVHTVLGAALSFIMVFRTSIKP